MKREAIEKELKTFASENGIKGKGPLALVLVVTRVAIEKGLPLDKAEFVTEAEGQVRGLGKAAVQNILRSHGITKVLAEEGGRTSRGSLGNMKKYVVFLNGLRGLSDEDLRFIEDWWVIKVKEFLESKPVRLKLDPAKSLRSVIGTLFKEMSTRQIENPGVMYVGAVLQHLVGAKLTILLDTKVDQYGASVADAVSGRPADFLVNDVAIHVTVTPGEGLLNKCKSNLENGLRPVIVTLGKGVTVAESLAEQVGIADRVDIFDGEQFIAGNLYELGGFNSINRKITASKLLSTYNEIVDTCETDPGLKIELI